MCLVIFKIFENFLGVCVGLYAAHNLFDFAVFVNYEC